MAPNIGTTSDQRSIRVLVVEDHLAVAQMAQDVLGSQEGIDVVGIAPDGATALRLTRETRPDVVLLDLMLPDLDGAEVARRIHETSPDTAIVVWTGHPDVWPPSALESLGVRGYLPKTVSVDGIVRTLQAVAQGHTVAVTVDPSGAHLAHRPLVTERKIAILRLLAADEHPAEIAEHLRLSARTVERDLADLRTKFEARSAADLVLKAQRRGLLPPAI